MTGRMIDCKESLDWLDGMRVFVSGLSLGPANLDRQVFLLASTSVNLSFFP